MLRPDNADLLRRQYDFAQANTIPNEKAVRQQVADEVSKTVTEHHLLDNRRFTNYSAKSHGMFRGCIFEGTNKSNRPKKIFVKHYSKTNIAGRDIDSEHDSLIDYAVFRILKSCGARAPKVRFKYAPDGNNKFSYYLFSTDITHPRKTHLNKTYWYGDIDSCQIRYIAEMHKLSSRKELLPKQSLLEDDNEFKSPFYKYDVDNRSAARLLLLGLIMQLKDLHVQNVGFVLSEKNGVIKGKPVFIDFYADKTELNIKRDSNLKELLMKHYSAPNAAEVIRELIANIPDAEFSLAMQDIEDAGFVDICDSLIQEATNVEAVATQMLQNFTKRIGVMKTNFLFLKAHFNLEQAQENDKNPPSQKCIIC